MDIVAFLSARLDEDEATAVWATGAVDGSTKPPSLLPGALAQWEAGPREVLRVGVPYGQQGSKLAGLSQQDIADHIARHDPAHVLRDVAAKRRLLTQAAAMRELATRELAPDIEAWFLLDMADSIERNLAAPYDQHPDFNPRWQLS